MLCVPGGCEGCQGGDLREPSVYPTSLWGRLTGTPRAMDTQDNTGTLVTGQSHLTASASDGGHRSQDGVVI
jgi:hypothetical protein